MANSRILIAGLLALAISPAARSASVEMFGLEHTFIGGATQGLDNYGRGFNVENLNIFGDGGVSTALGEADSGAFIYPYTGEVAEGYFMRGRAFGVVNGQTNAVIGTVSGYRSEYATFFVTADYSAIGATSLTFQLWNGSTLVSEVTAPSGEVRIFTESFPAPRANPWWRQTNGEYGASIELRYEAQMRLPNCNGSSCPAFYADRIFIRPNGATSVVDFVSRTDVLGGGGLPNFNLDDVRLGMFNRPHAALGDVKLVATNHTLTMIATEPGSEEGSGILAEFDPAWRAQIDLQPIALALPNTNGIRERLEISGSGTLLRSFGILGTVTLINSNGVLELSAYLASELFATLLVFSNDTLAGSIPLAAYENVRVDGSPRIISAGATADSTSEPASLFVDFDINATLTLSNGVQLVGNKVVVRANQPVGLADVSGVSIAIFDLPSFTIVGESSDPIVLPRLDIVRSGTNVLIRWPDPARAYYILYTPLADTYFSNLDIPQEHTNGITAVRFSLAESEMGFFRLVRNSYQYGD
jgi:hypothetical protein